MGFLGNLTGSNSAAFNFEDNMPSLQGKVIFITGCDSGIGKQAITYLAQLSPSEIWLAVRSLDQADVAVANIRQQVPAAKLQTLQLDLASFSSIKGAAAAFLAQTKRLDLLILNAGVMGTAAMRTEDGYEHQFGINYMGHALLTKLLMPALLQTAESQSDVRVIITTSYSHRNAPSGGIDFDTLKTDGGSLPTLKRYAQSKLANILFARAIAKRYSQLTALSIHPGAARTGLVLGATGTNILDRLVGQYVYRLFVFQPLETVAKHHVWAAVAQDIQSGEYYEPLGIARQGTNEAMDEALADKLWDWTEHELRPYFV